MAMKLANGQIFAVPLPDGTRICGRVTLDVYGALKRRRFPADSPVPGVGRAHLIEMYSAVWSGDQYVPSPILVPGAFVASHEIGKSWAMVGYRPVAPREVEFPESLVGFMHSMGQVAFQCGEIDIPLPLKRADLDQIDVFRVTHSPFLWPFTCLRAMGRGSEVPSEYKTASLVRADLRLSPHRARVYEHLPFPMEMPYYEKQKMLGLNLDRLYE